MIPCSYQAPVEGPQGGDGAVYSGQRVFLRNKSITTHRGHGQRSACPLRFMAYMGTTHTSERGSSAPWSPGQWVGNHAGGRGVVLTD